MTLPLEFIRDVARRYGYKEIELNETSHLISFRDTRSGSVRINVYYTTGTVGTCLNHPRRGKTQLFRRDVDVDALDSIFANPRVHTGAGYYHRSGTSQRWKKDGGADNGYDDEYRVDSARRWQYVGRATGLVRNDREMRTITEICTEWDGLYWEPNDPPQISETRFACGSHGGLLQMLYEVVGETCGDFQCCNKSGDKFCSGDDLPFSHHCHYEAAFLEEHDHDVRRLKQKFKHLRKDIRIELMQWLLGRDTQMVFADMSCRSITTKYSDSVRFAHFEYGELMYPKNAGMCRCCGVIFDKKE